MNKFHTNFIINLLHVKFVMLMINFFPKFYDLIFWGGFFKKYIQLEKYNFNTSSKTSISWNLNKICV
jgi:hypothetical protein